MHHRFAIAAATAAAALVFCAPAAPAANVTLGDPSLETNIGGFEARQSTTIVQTSLAGAVLRSPVTGVIVRWQLVDGTPGKPYRLRVLTPLVGGQVIGAGVSAPLTPTRPVSLESAPAAIPILAGQSVALEVETNSVIPLQPAPESELLLFRPAVGVGIASGGIPGTGVLGVSAEVQIPPTVTGIDPPSGSVEGGDSVAISGTDLQGASAVRFGGKPAESFEVSSEDKVVATAPPGAPGSVSVSVTTPAGTATAPSDYLYRVVPEERLDEDGGDGGDDDRADDREGLGSAACLVPKLKGKKLKVSKKRLRAAGCRTGKVRKRAGATARRGRVAKQSPKPGKRFPLGTKVMLTLR